MKERSFDALVVIASGVLMIAVVWFGFGPLYLKFSVIPLISFYFIGKYVQRKFVTELILWNSCYTKLRKESTKLHQGFVKFLIDIN